MFRSPERSAWPTIRRHALSTKWRHCGAVSVIAVAAVDHRVLEVTHMKNQIAALLLVVGCASSGANRLYQSSFLGVLTVTNQRTEDETIYVMHAGYKGRRLGQVNGLASATFELTPADAANASDVQFLATASLSGATEVSQSVTAERGARYEWELAPGRGHQFLSFRFMPK